MNKCVKCDKETSNPLVCDECAAKSKAAKERYENNEQPKTQTERLEMLESKLNRDIERRKQNEILRQKEAYKDRKAVRIKIVVGILVVALLAVLIIETVAFADAMKALGEASEYGEVAKATSKLIWSYVFNSLWKIAVTSALSYLLTKKLRVD